LHSRPQATVIYSSMTLRVTCGLAWRKRLAPILGAMLTLMVTMDGLCTVLNVWILEGSRRQIDITREGNLAAWFSGLVFGVVGLVCARLAWRAWSSTTRRALSACGWCVGSGAFGIYGVITATAIHAHAARAFALRLHAPWLRPPSSLTAGLLSIEAAGVLTLLLMCGGMLYAMRGNRGSVLLACLGLLLMASSPVVERFENRLISDPHNYVFVAKDQPYRFSHAAADRLWVVAHAKEGVETAGAIVLLAGLLSYCASADEDVAGYLGLLP
jgi:hypothetical protein